MIVTQLRAKGYEIVPVSELLGKTYNGRYARHLGQRALERAYRRHRLLALRH